MRSIVIMIVFILLVGSYKYSNAESYLSIPDSYNYVPVHPQADYRNDSNSLKIYENGVYKGNLNNNKYDPNSINNPYGRYGSPYSPESINNPYRRRDR